MSGVLILIPAAGASSRMRGRDKLIEEVRGKPLLRDRADMALGIGCQVLVTLPPDRPRRTAALADIDDPRFTRITVQDAQTGMSASLRCGARWAMDHQADALMILLPDLPDLTADDINFILQSYDLKSIIRATSEDGIPGHPVILPARLFNALATLSGDHGARDILRAHPVTPLALPGTRATTDLDTPEAWDAWRSAQNKKP
ncbi:CTP:molybdopterin cytidylyltransferase MocA [Roseovarius azorensis]|uniref:CTP:molybdopterin cytidylyltransferase MocA n=1 Tax=Roseovarius azorensis TaxID=1287727 RepID=A0A1H7W6X4_9RHOB|nr:nucleotidyltransferase family protein [Roseovarius azorensis]SEM17251.1 CTP:molybdopterin cytidylyltransferase MocA [Roseovarius azorensis]